MQNKSYFRLQEAQSGISSFYASGLNEGIHFVLFF